MTRAASVLTAVALFGAAAASVAGTVTESRPVANFNRVVLENIGDLTIHQGAIASLSIEAEPRLLAKLRTEVRGGVLYLGARGSVSTVQPVRFRLSAPGLGAIESRGSGDVDAHQLATERLDVMLSGSGDLVLDGLAVSDLDVRLDGSGNARLSGRVSVQRVTLAGAGSYDGRALASDSARLDQTGAGDATLSVRDRLVIESSGSGDVQIIGNPRIERNDVDAGNTEPLDEDNAPRKVRRAGNQQSREIGAQRGARSDHRLTVETGPVTQTQSGARNRQSLKIGVAE